MGEEQKDDQIYHSYSQVDPQKGEINEKNKGDEVSKKSESVSHS